MWLSALSIGGNSSGSSSSGAACDKQTTAAALTKHVVRKKQEKELEVQPEEFTVLKQRRIWLHFHLVRNHTRNGILDLA